MHTSRLRWVLLLIFTLGVPGLAFAQQGGTGGFTFVNNTSSTVAAIYLSPVQKHDWGFDRLGKKVLPAGASRFFKTPPRENCRFDVKVVFADDTPGAEFPKVGLCAITKMTLQYDRQARKVSYILE